MTVASNYAPVEHIGNGVTLVFAAPWRFLDPAHLVVETIDAGGDVTVLSKGVDYAVSGGETDDGGAVTMTTAPTSGVRVRIRRYTPRAQEADYITTGPFKATSHEEALDRLMLIAQEETYERIAGQERAFLVPDGELGAEVGDVAERASKFFAFDAEGNPFMSTGTGADAGLRSDLAAATGGLLVGFQHAGSAAVVRSARAKMRDTLSVADYGAIGDDSDETTEIQAAIDAAYDEGLPAVLFPYTDAGYRVSKNLIVRPGVSLIGDARKPTIRNVTGAGFGLGGVFLPGNFHPDFTEELTVYDCGAIAVGKTVTLVTPGDAGNFAVGDQVVTYSDEQGTSAGFVVPLYMHLNVIEAIAGAVITLRYPIDIAYAGGLARLAEVTTTGRGNEIPLFFAENSTIENFRVECESFWIDDSAAKNFRALRCEVEARSAVYGNSYQDSYFDDCSFRFWRGMGEMSHNSLRSGSRNCRFFQQDTTLLGNALAVDTDKFSQGFPFQEYARGITHTGFRAVTSATAAASCIFSAFRSAQDCYIEGDLHITTAGTVDEIVNHAPQSGGENSFERTGNGARLTVTGAQISRTFRTDAFTGANVYEGFKLRGRYMNPVSSGEAFRIDTYDGVDIQGAHFEYGKGFLTGAQSGHLIVDNYIADGFPDLNSATNEDALKDNVIRRNRSSRTLTREDARADSFNLSDTAIGVVEDKYAGNIGTIHKQRDHYDFEVILRANGSAGAKAVRIYVRNVTDGTDVALFTHSIAAGSPGVHRIRGSVFIDTTFVFGFSVRGATTGDYQGTATYNSAKEYELRIEGDCSVGADSTINWLKIKVDQENPYV